MGKFTKKAVSTAFSLTVAVVAFGFSIGHRSETGTPLKTKITTVKGHDGKSDKKKLQEGKRLSAVSMPRAQHDSNQKKALRNQGVFAFRAATAPVGLYSLSENCSETQCWEGEQYWIPTTGFKYGDSIYGISALYMYGTMYVDRMDYDIETGEMTFCESMDQNPEHAAISAVYDPDIDEAYAYTYTEDMAGYVFNRLLPESFEFIKLNDDVAFEDVCLAMTYDEKKGCIIGMTSDARLVKVNASTGIGTTLATLDIDQDTYTTSMAYCPDTNCYLYQMIDTDGGASMVAIDADDYSIVSQKKWPDGEIRQYTVMFSTTATFGNTSPSAPELSAFDFEGPALSGSVRILAPERYTDGNALTSGMTIELVIDDETFRTMDNVQPGAEATFNLGPLAEGSHTFSARAIVSDKSGSWIKYKKYVGYDNPRTPSNVRIDGNTALWEKVTEGESGGYIDANSIEYEVSLNGNYIGTTTDTCMTLSLPDMFTENQVSVTAVSNGRTSRPGVSETILSGMVALGETLQPTGNEWNCFTVYDKDNDGVTWEYDCNFGSYYSADRSQVGTADDWLVLPAYKVNDTGRRHILCFNVDVEGDRDAHIKIYQGTEPAPASMKEIGDFNFVNGENEGRQELYLLPMSTGKCHIAFQVLDKCSVYLESFNLSETDALASAADNVTDISVKADGHGNLTADVEFTLPVKAIDGTPLDNKIDVLVKSEVEELTLNGYPGEKKTTNIKVPQGLSRILVKTTNGSDCYSEQFFAGIDLPGAVDNITEELSDDNLSVKLRWDIPTEGANNGYIDPSSLFYSISIYDPEEGWTEIGNDIKTTEFSYSLPAGSKYDTYDFLIAAGNSIGLSDVGSTYTVAMGELYSLPLKDSMEDGGSIGPLLQMGGEGYEASWTTAFPEWYDEAASEIDDYVAVCVNYNKRPTKGSLIFPKFKPFGGEKIMTAFKFFFGDKTPDFKLYVLSPGDKTTLLADIESSKVARGYQTIRNIIPDYLKGSAWLQIMLEVDFDGSEQSLIFPYYAITAAFDKDIAVNSISGPATLLLGENGIYGVEIENVGYEDINVPGLSFNACSGDNVIADGNIVSQPENGILHPGDICSFECGISMDTPQYLGMIELCATVDIADKDLGNNASRSSIILSNDCRPVVTDLNAQASEDGVTLSWSKPEIGDISEGFENCAPFANVGSLGDFINIDNDGAYTYGYCFPYHTPGTNPTGWVVWDRETVAEAEYNNNYLPATGDRVAVAIAPCLYEDANDWLISPRIKSGSQVSFRTAGGMDSSTETLEILVSSTNREIESFRPVKTIMVENTDWTEETIQLPSDARYFALRYCSSSRGCLVMIDDLEFTPAAADAVFTGYDILSNGRTIAENAAADCSFTDTEGDINILYRVRPVYTLDGETHSGYLSNEASAAQSGIENISDAQYSIYGEKEHIVITGASGHDAEIYSIDGKIIRRFEVVNDCESIATPTGAYLVLIGQRAVKVIVR